MTLLCLSGNAVTRRGTVRSEKWTLIEGRGETDADVSAGGQPAPGTVPSGIRLQAMHMHYTNLNKVKKKLYCLAHCGGHSLPPVGGKLRSWQYRGKRLLMEPKTVCLTRISCWRS